MLRDERSSYGNSEGGSGDGDRECESGVGSVRGDGSGWRTNVAKIDETGEVKKI